MHLLSTLASSLPRLFGSDLQGQIKICLHLLITIKPETINHHYYLTSVTVPAVECV